MVDKRTVLSFVMIVTLFIPIGMLYTTMYGDDDLTLEDLCQFLESLYIDLGNGIGCLRESPRIEANVCYTNTNFIALHVLRLCNSSLVPKIEKFLEVYDNELYGRTEALLGYDVGLPRLTKIAILDRVDINGTEILIAAEKQLNECIPCYLAFTDLLTYTAIHYIENDEPILALIHIALIETLWNGKGFVDVAFTEHHLYESYKLGLYLYLMRILGIENEITMWIRANIDRFIHPVFGGIATHYNSELQPQGDPNVETTCVIAIALFSDYPKHIAEKHRATVEILRILYMVYRYFKTLVIIP